MDLCVCMRVCKRVYVYALDIDGTKREKNKSVQINKRGNERQGQVISRDHISGFMCIYTPTYDFCRFIIVIYDI